MNKATEKILKGTLACTMAFGMTACASGSGDTASSGNTVIIGISPDYPPYDDLTTDGRADRL